MPARRPTVKLTANFEANLAEIERFLEEAGEAGAGFVYDALLDELTATVLPNLERYPRIGRSFLDHQPQSVEAVTRLERLRSMYPDAELLEYLSGDYLLLYTRVKQTIYLLSIKHHKQLSFDFAYLWT